MSQAEFVELVAQMREAQSQFFKTRDPDWLGKAKRLERRVDAELERVAVATDPAPQRRLF